MGSGFCESSTATAPRAEAEKSAMPVGQAVRDLMRRLPELKTSERTDADNPGITFVEL